MMKGLKAHHIFDLTEKDDEGNNLLGVISNRLERMEHSQPDWFEVGEHLWELNKVMEWGELIGPPTIEHLRYLKAHLVDIFKSFEERPIETYEEEAEEDLDPTETEASTNK